MTKTNTYSNIEQGIVVLTDLMYSNQIGIKKRPALVISNSLHNKTSEDVVVLKITSTNKKTLFDVSVTNSDLEFGKLDKDSHVMVDYPVTIEKKQILMRLAKVTGHKLLEVKAKIKAFYGL